MEHVTQQAESAKPAHTVVGVLTEKLKSADYGNEQKMEAIRERIAARMSQIVGLLHFVMEKDYDATLHNLIHLLASVDDDQDLRSLVCSDAVDNPVAMDVARRIEEGFESAGRNVRPRIAALTDRAEKVAALKTLIRYVQHLLTLAKQGERVRYMLNAVTGALDSRGVALRADNAAKDAQTVELFFHLERGLAETGFKVNPEMPALREMFAYYDGLLKDERPEGQ